MQPEPQTVRDESPGLQTDGPRDAARGWRWAAWTLGAACLALFGLALWLALAVSVPGPAATVDAPALPVAPPAMAPQPVQAPVLAKAPASSEAPERVSGNLLLHGAVASGCKNPHFLNDGDAASFDGSNGFAEYDIQAAPDGAMVVTLPRLTQLSRLRFLLWDKDGRTYRYAASVSSDGSQWSTVKDSSGEDQKSWQEIKFERRPVLAVRIKGVSNSANTGFHVVELEGYDDGPQIPPRKPPRGPLAVKESKMRPGLWAEFFDGIGTYPNVEDRPTLARPVRSCNFGQLQPPAGQGLRDWPLSGACSAILSGCIKIEAEGLYTFYLTSDDGSRLYVDGELLADNDGNHPMQEMWGQADLRPGLHRIWIEYYNRGGPLGLNIALKGPGMNRGPLDGERLYYEPGDAAISGL